MNVPHPVDLGRVAYEAYLKASGNKSLVTGNPLPEWDEVKKDIKLAWIASSEAVVIEIKRLNPPEAP